jgi:hypothetical protein
MPDIGDYVCPEVSNVHHHVHEQGEQQRMADEPQPHPLDEWTLLGNRDRAVRHGGGQPTAPYPTLLGHGVRKDGGEARASVPVL